MLEYKTTRSRVIGGIVGAIGLTVLLVQVCSSDSGPDTIQRPPPAEEVEPWSIAVGNARQGTRLTGPAQRTAAATDTDRLGRMALATTVSAELDKRSPGARAIAGGRDLTVLQFESALCDAEYLSAVNLAALQERGFERVECTDGAAIWVADVPR